jgi:hypothetical protein
MFFFPYHVEQKQIRPSAKNMNLNLVGVGLLFGYSHKFEIVISLKVGVYGIEMDLCVAGGVAGGAIVSTWAIKLDK